MRVDNKTTIEKSEKKYEIKEDKDELTSLNLLCDIQPYTKMNCKGKVIQLEEATKAANGKNIQNILIADRTATARVTLWEEDINKLVTNKSYQFKQLVLKEFRGERQLSSIKDRTKIA